MRDQEVIAETVLYAVDKVGRGFDIGVQIGRPYRVASPHGDWRCPLALVGLHGRFPDIFGDDSLQALSAALKLSRTLLEVFVEHGGQLFWKPGGEPITVGDVFGDIAEPSGGDGVMAREQIERVSKLSQDELDSIDAAILRNCSGEFRKIARVIGEAMSETSELIPNVPDVFYADRARELVAQGKLESQGNITAMRFGEVKLA